MGDLVVGDLVVLLLVEVFKALVVVTHWQRRSANPYEDALATGRHAWSPQPGQTPTRTSLRSRRTPSRRLSHGGTGTASATVSHTGIMMNALALQPSSTTVTYYRTAGNQLERERSAYTY